jgi:serine protease Do
VLPALIAVIVVAAAAFGASRLFGSSSQDSPSPPPVNGNTQPIMWLGMEIITSPQGIPLVETVRPNSNGDRAGIEPGDAIVLINNKAVGSTGSISDALKGLHSGDRVSLEVNNGGAILTLAATLAAPPSPYP